MTSFSYTRSFHTGCSWARICHAVTPLLDEWWVLSELQVGDSTLWGFAPSQKNARKARPKPSPHWLALPHPDHWPRKWQWKTIAEVSVVIFHPNSLHMHLHDLFLRFIKPPVRLYHHSSRHSDFLRLFGLYPPSKISTWTSTFRTKASFKNAT